MKYKLINQIYTFLLSEKVRKESEKIIFITAIIAFILHLGLIAFTELNIIPGSENKTLRALNFLSATYTPFTVILLYEIYSMIYYFPKSFSVYLGKQYELIVLILVRRMFYVLSTIPWDTSLKFEGLKELLISFAGLIVFSLLIFLFYKLSNKKKLYTDEYMYTTNKHDKYYMAKKVLAIGLLFLFVTLTCWSIFTLRHISLTADNTIYVLKSINDTFFDVFFTALILTEILVLLLSFSLSDQFHKIIRNSGFIISTVLLKLSFKAEGITNTIIIFSAIAFGVAILGVYRLFENTLAKKGKDLDGM